jgi:Protein of unknown function (DUF3040)
MLSEPEQRRLHEIERILTATDPKLATLLGARPGGRRRVERILHDVVCVMSLLLGLLCLVLGQVSSGFASVAFAVLVIQTRRMRFPPNATARTPVEPHPI